VRDAAVGAAQGRCKEPFMTDVSILGLGPMGHALAATLLRAQRSVTVWNRTAARAAALAGAGAHVAPSPAAAVSASPVVIVCITDYPASFAALESTALAGKVVIQLTTGTPGDARAGAAWATARGADYLDGAILAVPSQIGQPESTILVSGAATALRAGEPLLQQLVGTASYLGAAVGAAAALDLAILSYLFVGLVGFYHGARILESEGLEVGVLGALVAGTTPAISGMVQHDAERIVAGNYGDPQSSLEICARTFDLLVRHAREAGLDGQIPALGAAVFERGRAAGFGAESPAALVKVLRGGAR
jgi:3-hydroxyisobutyrate dehydrogenase-like beta-hydroxyacid dehydrogenase